MWVRLWSWVLVGAVVGVYVSVSVSVSVCLYTPAKNPLSSL